MISKNKIISFTEKRRRRWIRKKKLTFVADIAIKFQDFSSSDRVRRKFESSKRKILISRNKEEEGDEWEGRNLLLLQLILKLQDFDKVRRKLKSLQWYKYTERKTYDIFGDFTLFL